ncbi:MAG: glycosyltransferase family 39 protein [Chloroflexota bacterium]|nr:glycosyltransferase family 39 protein [Chloroflexota bacterium]
MKTQSKPPNLFIYLLILLTLGAFLLRLLALGSKSLVPDEGSSYFFSQLPLQRLIWQLCDPHPPGYYLMLRAVTTLGTSEWWLRFPSALLGALAVPLTWTLAREVIPASLDSRWREWAAIATAALIAVAPLHVWYSQEARPYALLTTLALGMVLAGLRWWKHPRLVSAFIYLILGWSALFVEYGALVIWGGLNLILASGWPWREQEKNQPHNRGLRWALLQAALLLPFVGWWLISPQRQVLRRFSYQADFLAVRAQALGVSLTPELARPLLSFTLLAAICLAFVLAFILARYPRSRDGLRSLPAGVILLVLFAGLAILGVLPALFTIKRHLVILLPFAAVAAAWVIVRDRPSFSQHRNRWGILATGLFAILLTLSLMTILTAPKPPWNQVAAALARETRPDDSLWVDELDAPVFNYYWQQALSWHPLFANNLEALNQIPAGQRAWVVGTVSPYRDLNATLPAEFAASRKIAAELQWPGIAGRAYDHTTTRQPVSEPTQAHRWGLSLPSPIDTSCTIEGEQAP